MENRPLAIGILASVAVLLLVTGCGDGADHTGMTEAEPTVITDLRVDKKTVPTPNAGTTAKYVIEVLAPDVTFAGLPPAAKMNRAGDVVATWYQDYLGLDIKTTVWECPFGSIGPCAAPRVVGPWSTFALTDGVDPRVIHFGPTGLVSTSLQEAGDVAIPGEVPPYGARNIYASENGDVFVDRDLKCSLDYCTSIYRYGPAGFKKQDPFLLGHVWEFAPKSGEFIVGWSWAGSHATRIVDRDFISRRTLEPSHGYAATISSDGTSTVHRVPPDWVITVAPPPSWSSVKPLSFKFDSEGVDADGIGGPPKVISRRGGVVGNRQYQYLTVLWTVVTGIESGAPVQTLKSQDFLIEFTYGPADSGRIKLAAIGPVSRILSSGTSIGGYKIAGFLPLNEREYRHPDFSYWNAQTEVASAVLAQNGRRDVSRDDDNLPAFLIAAQRDDGKPPFLLRARRVCDVSHSENTLQDVKQGATPHGDICANPSRPTTGLLSCDPDPSNPLKKRTIRNVGCALTGFTNVVNFFNGTNVPIADAENKTDDFNTMLADAGMFDGESNLRFADVTNAHMLTNIYSQVWNLRYFGRDAPGVHPGGDGADVTTRETFVDDPLSPIVDFFVCNGEPVIVKVANCKVGGDCTGHFVVATGRDVARRVGELSDQATALINDPARLSSPPDLLQDGPLTGPNRWHRANRIYGVRAYSKQQFAGGGKTHVGLLINSPVEVLVQDPLGRRLGYDHLSGETFDEIPNAALTDDSFATPDGEPVSHARHIAIGGPEDVFGNQPGGVSQGAVHGTYSFVVRGTGEGPFTLTFSSLDSEGGVRNRIVAGYARPGSVETIQLERHPTGEAVLFRSSIGARTRADVDYNGAVDRSDVDLITRARGRAADGADDPLDVDQDGQITALDARRATLLCTRPRCAIQ